MNDQRHSEPARNSCFSYHNGFLVGEGIGFHPLGEIISSGEGVFVACWKWAQHINLHGSSSRRAQVTIFADLQSWTLSSVLLTPCCETAEALLFVELLAGWSLPPLPTARLGVFSLLPGCSILVLPMGSSTP